jgi:hypothetical protein
VRRVSARPCGLALCLLAFAAYAQDEPDSSVPPRVAAIYDQGKAAYDAKDYATALQRFDRCIELEPSRARWHYNRGLALKKLGRDGEARDAFADSQRMDPEYKKVEIGKKLAELGGAPSSSDTTTTAAGGGVDVEALAGGCAGLLPFIVFCAVVVYMFRKKAQLKGAAEPAQLAPPEPDAPAADWNGLIAAHQQRAARLAPLEHAVAASADAAFQAAVMRAGDELQFARRLLLERRDGEAAQRCGERADQALNEAAQKSGGASGRGERVGCFFCALAAPSMRRGVTLGLGGAQHGVVACARCASKAQSGAPLTVRVVDGAPWATSPAFDPYQHAYWSGPPSDELPVWKLQPEQVSPLGPLAAGLAAFAVLDLVAAREAGLAAEASAAAARHASGGRSPHSNQWRDHS